MSDENNNVVLGSVRKLLMKHLTNATDQLSVRNDFENALNTLSKQVGSQPNDLKISVKLDRDFDPPKVEKYQLVVQDPNPEGMSEYIPYQEALRQDYTPVTKEEETDYHNESYGDIDREEQLEEIRDDQNRDDMVEEIMEEGHVSAT